MVLFLFVIMFMNLNAESEPQKSKWMKFAAVLSGGSLMLILIAALKDNGGFISSMRGEGSIGLIKNLGKVLFTDYVVPFEISSILFLSAMVGAVVLGKKDSSTIVS
jgi:NADH-quinone oxidoreductase subunit J